MTASRDLPKLAAVLAIGVFAFLPMARLPAFYDSSSISSSSGSRCRPVGRC